MHSPLFITFDPWLEYVKNRKVFVLISPTVKLINYAPMCDKSLCKKESNWYVFDLNTQGGLGYNWSIYKNNHKKMRFWDTLMIDAMLQ